MNVRDLIPWGRGNHQAPAVYRDNEQNPVLALHREMNRLFDDVFRSFELSPVGGRGLAGMGVGWPSIEVADDEDAVRVTAELAGMEEKDVEVLLDGDVLMLRGEKRASTEGKGGRQFSERFYGRFERRIPLGYEIDEDKVEAQFRNGVLTVTLPKTARAQSRVKRIGIKH